MSKKKTKINPENRKAKAPEFKPGDKPYLEYDGVLLNANVPWNELVSELEATGCTSTDIAQYAECELSTIQEISTENYDNLSFRAGARIVTLHHKRNPHMYSEF